MLRQVQFAALLDRQQIVHLAVAVGLRDGRISADGQQRPFLGAAEFDVNRLADIAGDGTVNKMPICCPVCLDERFEFRRGLGWSRCGFGVGGDTSRLRDNDASDGQGGQEVAACGLPGLKATEWIVIRLGRRAWRRMAPPAEHPESVSRRAKPWPLVSSGSGRGAIRPRGLSPKPPLITARPGSASR